MKNNMPTKQKQKDLYKPFEITSVARADLDGEGFDTSNIDDSTMEELASKMAEAYTESVFWVDLEIIAGYLGIPKK